MKCDENYNRSVINKIFEECSKVIEESSDINIKKKKEKFEVDYNNIFEKNTYKIQDFYATAHELKTYEFFKNKGFDISAHNDNTAGPDFKTSIGYVECVTFTMPDDSNSKEIINLGLNIHSAFEPRFTGALKDKNDTFNDYLNDGILNVSLPRIICLHTGMCNSQMFPTTQIRCCEEILYGLGSQVVCFNMKTTEHVGTFREYEEEISKPSNNKTIPINYFNGNEYDNISGVLLITDTLYDDYKQAIMFINHNAKVQVDKSLLKDILIFEKVDNNSFHYVLNDKEVVLDEVINNN
jgi:hypothetical protein